MSGETSADFWPRVVIDESSFDFRNVADPDVESALESFNDAVEQSRSQGQAPAVCSLYSFVECRDGVELFDLLFARATDVDPDVCRRTAVLLDRCDEWDELAPSGCEPASLRKAPIDAYSVGFACAMRRAGRIVGCLVVPTSACHGWKSVPSGSSTQSVFFFAMASEARVLWRSVFDTEAVGEQDFFAIAAFAFPTLAFQPQLRFGRFTGSYMAVRDAVVRILSAIEDHFGSVLTECKGLPYDVDAAMGRYGVDLSPESPKTRASESLMRQRDVDYDGTTYRCEWHAKIEPHRNRIHFTLPTQGPQGHILIGIFAEHLPVE